MLMWVVMYISERRLGKRENGKKGKWWWGRGGAIL